VEPHTISEDLFKEEEEEKQVDIKIDRKKIFNKRKEEMIARFQKKREEFSKKQKNFEEVNQSGEKCHICLSNISDEPYGCLAFLSTTNLYHNQIFRRIEKID